MIPSGVHAFASAAAWLGLSIVMKTAPLRLLLWPHSPKPALFVGFVIFFAPPEGEGVVDSYWLGWWERGLLGVIGWNADECQ